MKKISQGWLLWPLIITIAASLNFDLPSSTPECIKILGGEEYHLTYQISGVNEASVALTITTETRTSAFKKFNNTDYVEENIKLPAGKWLFCFEATDNTIPKIVSFDLYPTSDPIRSLITKQELLEVQEVLRKSYEGYNRVNRNHELQTERDQVHMRLLETSEEKIKITGVLKIVLLLCSALVQLWIMKGFFKDRTDSSSGRAYNPVETR